MLRMAGAAASALGLDSAKAEKDGRSVPHRRRRTAQLLLIGITAAALAWVYSGELFMMRSLHAGGASAHLGTTTSDTEVYYELLEEAGIRTSSDSATIAAAALGGEGMPLVVGGGDAGVDAQLLGSSDAAAAAPVAGGADAVAAAAVRMATRMALVRLMMR